MFENAQHLLQVASCKLHFGKKMPHVVVSFVLFVLFVSFLVADWQTVKRCHMWLFYFCILFFGCRLANSKKMPHVVVLFVLFLYSFFVADWQIAKRCHMCD